jgi:hypothetical protein
VADEWFYTQHGQQQGPVAAAQLKQLAVSGKLRPTDLVWKEGMANWVPASATRGLFPSGPPSSGGNARPAGAPSSGANARPAGAPSSGANARPAAAGSSAAHIRPAGAPASAATPRPAAVPARRGPVHVLPIDDEDDAQPLEHERRPRRRSKGLTTGAWVAIIGGSVGGVVLIGVVILAIVLLSRGGNGYSTPTLFPGGSHPHFVQFQAGKMVEITVTSDHDSDMDLFVYDPFNRLVAQDVSIGPNSFVSFIPTQAGMYRLEVRNVSTMPNRSHVRYRQ